MAIPLTQLSQQMKHLGFVLTVETLFGGGKPWLFTEESPVVKSLSLSANTVIGVFSREPIYKNIFAKGKLLVLGLC